MSLSKYQPESIVAMLIIAIAAPFVAAVAIMICWNAVMVGTFGLPELSYWSAFFLFLLVKILLAGTVKVNKD